MGRLYCLLFSAVVGKEYEATHGSDLDQREQILLNLLLQAMVYERSLLSELGVSRTVTVFKTVQRATGIVSALKWYEQEQFISCNWRRSTLIRRRKNHQSKKWYTEDHGQAGPWKRPAIYLTFLKFPERTLPQFWLSQWAQRSRVSRQNDPVREENKDNVEIAKDTQNVSYSQSRQFCAAARLFRSVY